MIPHISAFFLSGKINSAFLTNISNFTVYLNDDLVNMDQIVSVSYNDKEIYKGHVKRDSNIIRESTIEHGDPQSVYFGEIEININ